MFAKNIFNAQANAINDDNDDIKTWTEINLLEKAITKKTCFVTNLIEKLILYNNKKMKKMDLFSKNKLVGYTT